MFESVDTQTPPDPGIEIANSRTKTHHQLERPKPIMLGPSDCHHGYALDMVWVFNELPNVFAFFILSTHFRSH